MLLRVPADLPDLSAAVERAEPGDEIRVEGVVTGGVRITKEVTLSGGTEDDPAAWGVIRGGGPRALILGAAVRLDRIRVENPGGHGVRLEAGTSHLTRVWVEVAETAFGIVDDATPFVLGCTAARCNNGMLVIGTARPQVHRLRVTASGGGLVVRERGAGHFEDLLLLSGNFAAVEAADDAAPEVHGAQIHAGTGGIFVRDRARPTLGGIHVHRCGLAGLEVTGTADPQVRGLHVAESGGAGMHLHGQARGTYLDVTLRGARAVAVNVAERAVVALERLDVAGCLGAGLYVHDDAEAEVDFLTVTDPQGAAVEAEGRARLRIDDATLAGAVDGVRAGGRAEVVLRRAAFSRLSGEPVVSRGDARVDR